MNFFSILRSIFSVTKASAEPVKKVAPAFFVAAAVLIGGFEGMDLTAVHNSFDPPGVITYCQGLTNQSEDKSVKAGQKFTPEYCNQAFAATLPKYMEPISKCVPGMGKYPQGVQLASLSLAYNIGPTGFCKSSIARNLNAGKRKEACDAFLLYNKSNGKVLKGLVTRRQKERALCLSSD